MIWIRHSQPKFLALLNYKVGFSTFDHIMDNYVKNQELLTRYQLYKLIQERDLSDYVKFTIVRNPYARVVSTFCQKLQDKPRERIDNEWYDPIWPLEDNQKQVLYELVNYKNRDLNDIAKWTHFLTNITFETFVEVLQVIYEENGHFAPQIKLLTDFFGDFIPDKIFKLENLESDWSEIMKILGCNIPYVKKNVTDRPHYSTFYSDKTKGIIGDLYSEDIEVFDYEFEYE